MIKSFRFKKPRLFIRFFIWLFVILIAMVAIMLTKMVFWEGYQVPTPSMTPTLRVGDVAWVDKSAFGKRWPWVKNPSISLPSRSDVVVFIHPKTQEYYVKRVVGLPSDTVMILGRKVYLNGEEFEKVAEFSPQMTNLVQNNDWGVLGKVYWMQHQNKKYRVLFTKTESLSWSFSGYWVVPKDHFFVLGDLRDESSDSREWGMVHKDALVGKVKCIVDAGIKTQSPIPKRSNCNIDQPTRAE